MENLAFFSRAYTRYRRRNRDSDLASGLAEGETPASKQSLLEYQLLMNHTSSVVYCLEGEAYPELYAAIGVHSELPYGTASDVASAFAAMRDELGGGHPLPRLVTGGEAVPTIVFHGSADRTVHPSNAHRIIAAARVRAGEGEVRRVRGRAPDGRTYTRTIALTPDGAAAAELWLIEGAGHAWSGGQTAGSYTDPAGPDASAEMVRFFLNAPRRGHQQ